jgi:hypothetical protein
MTEATSTLTRAAALFPVTIHARRLCRNPLDSHAETAIKCGIRNKQMCLGSFIEARIRCEITLNSDSTTIETAKATVLFHQKPTSDNRRTLPINYVYSGLWSQGRRCRARRDECSGLAVQESGLLEERCAVPVPSYSLPRPLISSEAPQVRHATRCYFVLGSIATMSAIKCKADVTTESSCNFRQSPRATSVINRDRLHQTCPPRLLRLSALRRGGSGPVAQRQQDDYRLYEQELASY